MRISARSISESLLDVHNFFSVLPTPLGTILPLYLNMAQNAFGVTIHLQKGLIIISQSLSFCLFH